VEGEDDRRAEGVVDAEEEEDEEEEEEEEDIFNSQEGFPSVGKGKGGAKVGDDDEEDTQTGKGKKKAKSGGFESMGFCYPVYRGIKMKGYRVPTPIQRKTIPLVMFSSLPFFFFG